jgi:hypothetical protein
MIWSILSLKASIRRAPGSWHVPLSYWRANIRDLGLVAVFRYFVSLLCWLEDVLHRTGRPALVSTIICERPPSCAYLSAGFISGSQIQHH